MSRSWRCKAPMLQVALMNMIFRVTVMMPTHALNQTSAHVMTAVVMRKKAMVIKS